MSEFTFEKPSVNCETSPAELETLLNRDYSDYDPEDIKLPFSPASLKIKRVDEFATSKTGYVIDGIIPDNSLTGIFGPPKLGKAFLAMQAAFCVQNGISFLGHRTKPGDVLYIDYNYNTSEVRKKFEMIANYYKDIVPDPIMPYTMSINPAYPASLVKVLDTARMHKWDHPELEMVILNNFYSFCEGDPNDELNAAEKLKWLKNLATNDKMAVVYIHHSNKTTSGTLDDIVYSSGGNGIHKKLTDSCIALSNGKSRNEPILSIESAIVQKAQPLVRNNFVFEKKGGKK